jgi:hypothetical protein
VSRARIAAALSWLVSLSCGCHTLLEDPKVEVPPSGIDWDSGSPFYGSPSTATPYTGDDPFVLEAQRRWPDGLTLQSEVVRRSCGPIDGVCHNQKEYPDLHTPANFVGAIGAPCNVQSGNPEGVFDRCERVGDRLEVDGSAGRHEIGWVEFIPPEDEDAPISPTMPGLHFHFKEAVPTSHHDRWRTIRLIRTLLRADRTVEDLSYAEYTTMLYVFDEGRHLVARVANYQINTVLGLLAVGIEQGDLNRNGIYGARPQGGISYGPISLIEPGSPETSYLVARMRGFMRRTDSGVETLEEVPGTRMPLANQPFSVPEMVALFCFIEGLDPALSTVNLSSPIDYGGCSYALDTSLLDGLAVEGEPGDCSWDLRVKRILSANCGGCHDSSEDTAGELALLGEGIHERLLLPSVDDPLGRPLVAPGDPEGSYLFLKLGGLLEESQSEVEYIEAHSLAGALMPDAPSGFRPLSAAALADIRAWIQAGASETASCTTP